MPVNTFLALRFFPFVKVHRVFLLLSLGLFFISCVCVPLSRMIMYNDQANITASDMQVCGCESKKAMEKD